MKYFQNENGDLFAYELDGSQDELIPKHYTSLTPEQHSSKVQEKQAALQAERDDEVAAQDPVAKLQSFLAANPDVAALLGQK